MPFVLPTYLNWDFLGKVTTQRMPLADAIARIGPGAAAVLSEELQKTTAPSEALRLLDVLPHAVPESIACVVDG